MFCPRCGEERISQETSYCSKCGYLLTATSDLLRTDGVARTDSNIAKDSPRSRGVKQGIFLIVLAAVLAPVLGLILRFGFNMMPWPMGVFLFLFAGGGLLRIFYALMFEPKHEARLSVAGAPTRELSAADNSEYISPLAVNGRLNTNELEPHSVTDETTKLLKKEKH